MRSRVALFSACSTFIPAPGLDLAADVALLIKLSHDLLEIYGLTEDQLDFEIRMHLKSPAWGIALKKKVAKALKSYTTTEGVLMALRIAAPKLPVKQVAKWFPIAGQAVAVIIGYKLTSTYASEVINQLEELALEAFQELRTPVSKRPVPRRKLFVIDSKIPVAGRS